MESIKMGLEETGCAGVDSCGSGCDPVTGSWEHGSEHSSSIEDATFLDQMSDSPLMAEVGKLFLNVATGMRSEIFHTLQKLRN
jgi:hypothetical protein